MMKEEITITLTLEGYPMLKIHYDLVENSIVKMKGTSPKSQIAEKLKKIAAKTELTIIYYSYEMAIIIPVGF